RPVVRPEPHRQHRRRRDRAAGDLRRRVVVPEQRVAVLDRRARRPDVAPLDRELAGLLVLHLPDQRLDVGGHRALRGRAHAATPSSRSAAISSFVKPASPSSASVSVTVASRTVGPGWSRRMPANTQPTCSNSPWPGESARTNTSRGRELPERPRYGTRAYHSTT